MRLRILSRTLAAVAIAVLSTALGGPAPSAQAHPTRTVLTIHWGAEDFPGTLALDAAIREVLQSQAGPPVNYYAEYLETEIFPAEPASLALRDYIREKFEGRRIDLVITNTTPALQFALRHRGELFPDVPIVFVAGPTRELKLDRAAAVTGVVSDVTFAETLDLALKLHPSVQRVFVVAQAPTSPDYAGRVRAVLERFSEHVELTYISEKSVPGLLAAVNAIPAGSLILYTRYQPVEAERVVYTDEIARLMAQVSAVPIYGTTDLYMGSGVVGGMMRSSRTTGTRVGEMVRRILNGTPPENIPIESVRFVPTFDWRQLRRWGIDSSRLPPDSDIQFRTPTTWESYRWYIVGTVIVVAAQLLLIVGLLTQRARRRRAEETIRAREATLRTSYERIRHLAGRLINAQEAARADIARDLHDDVCQRLVYVSMAVNSLKASSGRIQDEEAQEGLSELERDTLGVFDGIRRLSHELHPVSLRLLGLAPALKTHCVEFEKRHNVHVSFRIEGDVGQMLPDVAVCFFRIAQESLRNGLVHGHAQQFTVSLVRSGAQVEQTVTDDGRGFDLDAVRRDGGGLGLVSMEERAHLVGAEVHIVTGCEGTTIRVRGPAGPPQPIRLPDATPRSDATPAERLPAVSQESDS